MSNEVQVGLAPTILLLAITASLCYFAPDTLFYSKSYPKVDDSSPPHQLNEVGIVGYNVDMHLAYFEKKRVIDENRVGRFLEQAVKPVSYAVKNNPALLSPNSVAAANAYSQSTLGSDLDLSGFHKELSDISAGMSGLSAPTTHTNQDADYNDYDQLNR